MLSKKRFLSSIVLFVWLSSHLVIAFASSDNWSEVARLTGGGVSTTESFTVDHVDWRLRWEIEPSNSSERTAFLVYIFPCTGIQHSEQWFESIQHFGTEETSGVLYIYDHNGTFNMDVLASAESYTMIIEQNLDSIPEFPSWIPLLTLLVTVMAVAVIYRRILSKPNGGRRG